MNVEVGVSQGIDMCKFMYPPPHPDEHGLMGARKMMLIE